jgi:hypothetical protein
VNGLSLLAKKRDASRDDNESAGLLVLAGVSESSRPKSKFRNSSPASDLGDEFGMLEQVSRLETVIGTVNGRKRL